MKPTSIKNLSGVISRELNFISVVFYVSAVGIGMLFSYYKYAAFNINIFNYLDLLDFLIIPFSDVSILLFTAISLVLVYVIFRMDSLWRTKFPSFYSKVNFRLDRHKWFETYRMGMFFFIFFLYLFTGAKLYGKLAHKKIENEPGLFIQFTSNEETEGKLIGKTKEVIFILDKEQKVKYLPLMNIQSFGEK